MCLILFAHRVSAGYPLVFAANRDELFSRPTAPARFWDDAPHVLAGRDLRAGGTWMGVTRSGRWAAVTNYRGAVPDAGEPRSRGRLVADYLMGDQTPEGYVERLLPRADEYAGFNLLVGDDERVVYFGNRGGSPRALEPGIYGLSNHLLDTPWPKVERGKRAIQSLLGGGGVPEPESLLEILYDTEIAPDDQLPDTGLGRELERLASAPFIVHDQYGTRSSTGLVKTATGAVTFVERTFLPGPVRDGEVRIEFEITA
jgi:uncharacterized protein with NRDE domain